MPGLSLERIARFTATRDRHEAAAMLPALAQQITAARRVLYLEKDAPGDVWHVRHRVGRPAPDMEKLMHLVQRATASGRSVRAIGAHGVWAAYPLLSPPATPGALVLHLPRRDRKNEGELNRLLRIYRNILLLHERSEWDALTGLHNRQSFGDEVGRLMYPARTRNGRRTEEKDHWLSILDIDHFKRVNDEHGHLIGDEVLLAFAQLMRQSFRFDDRLFRYGGEEFIIILEGNSDEKTFQALDRFRHQVEEHVFPRAVRITVSVGYTHIDRDASPSEIIDHADRALYYAKTHGRNCVHGYETLIAQGKMQATEYATYQDVQLWRGGASVPTSEEERQ